MLETTITRPVPRRRAATIATLLLAMVMAVTAAGFSPLGAGVAHGAARLKAVVIVGPSGSMQSSNLSNGESIAQAAASYGMDVRRVFHPNATWSAVLANIQGASIVVYLGHGNGWPSPYAPFQTNTKDGLGLNPSAGGSAYSVQYYGEGPIATYVDLAPNAVVLLNHLCYASGNSEPGQPAPTVAVARERVDNYAAGFLRAGARAVFAYAYSDVRPVIRDLFTAHDTIDEIFMGSGYFGTRDIRFPSVRTPGYDVHMDPESSTKYGRSVVGRLSMTAEDVTGAPFARTDTVPDSTGPRPWDVSPAALAFSPNGDGSADTLPVTVTWSENASWTTTIERADGTDLATWNGSGAEAAFTWDGLDSGGTRYGDGQYRLRLSAIDALGNVGDPSTETIRIDTVAPTLAQTGTSTLATASDAPKVFTPNGDGTSDALALGYDMSEAGSLSLVVTDGGGTVIRRRTIAVLAGTGTVTWDGRNDAGSYVPEGPYDVKLGPRDQAGNVGDPIAQASLVLTALRSVNLAPATFYSRDMDKLARYTQSTFTLTKDATVTWSVTTFDGAPIKTLWTDHLTASGSYVWSWDGKNTAGAYVADGKYLFAVTATTAAGTVTYRRVVFVGAFQIVPSTATLTRGKSVTVNITSAEPLSRYPSLTVVQPGVAAYTIMATKTGTYTYKVTFTPKSGTTGTVVLKVYSKDIDGVGQQSQISVRLN